MKNWRIIIGTLITFSVGTEPPVGVKPKKTHVICFARRVPKFRVDNFFFGGGAKFGVDKFWDPANESITIWSL